MNTPEPFNDLSWNDDPLHSPNRTIYIEKLRAAVVELGATLKYERNTNAAMMTQLKLVINSLAKEDAERMALAFSAIDGIEYEPWIPPAEAAALRARVKELEAERDAAVRDAKAHIVSLNEAGKFVAATVLDYSAKLTALEKEVSDLKENLRNAEAEFLESGDRYRDQIRQLTKERDQLKGEVERLGKVLKVVPETVSVEEFEKRINPTTHDATERQKE